MLPAAADKQGSVSCVCVCSEDSQVLGGLDLAGVGAGSPAQPWLLWGLLGPACMWFPAEQHAQGPEANWEQVAGLANAAELVADCGVDWAVLVPGECA